LQHQAEGARFETSYVVIFTYLPPADATNKMTNFLVEGEKGQDDAGGSARALRTFKAALAEFEDGLSYNLRFRRLRARKAEVDGQQVTFDDLLRRDLGRRRFLRRPQTAHRPASRALHCDHRLSE
jgi:hypothetical protein